MWSEVLASRLEFNPETDQQHWAAVMTSERTAKVCDNSWIDWGGLRAFSTHLIIDDIMKQQTHRTKLKRCLELTAVKWLKCDWNYWTFSAEDWAKRTQTQVQKFTEQPMEHRVLVTWKWPHRRWKVCVCSFSDEQRSCSEERKEPADSQKGFQRLKHQHAKTSPNCPR